MALFFTKTVGLQHPVQVFRRRVAPLPVGRLCGAFKGAFIEIHHAGRWVKARDRSGFKNLVIQGDGEFPLTSPSTDKQVELLPNDSSLRDGLATQSVRQRLVRGFDACDNETTSQADVLECGWVNHERVRVYSRFVQLARFRPDTPEP